MQVQPCPGCLQHGAGIKFTGSTPRGICSGTLDFRCKGCNAPRFLKRSRALTGGGLVGMDRDENTERLADAFDFAGIGYAQTVLFLSGSDQPVPCKATWYAAVDRFQAAGKSSLLVEIDANREKERVATLLYEGESCRSPSGKIQIRVITDGSWQKRYGRNSLWGYSAMYGFYTGKEIFVAHRCARCTTCWMAAARGAPPGEHKFTMNWDNKKGADEGAAGNMEKHSAQIYIPPLLKPT